MVLHCIRSQASLLLLVAPMYWFFCWTTSQRCHVRRFGQSQAPPTKQRYIPRHLFTAKFDNCVLSILPAFHSLTGSDSTSFLAGHTKKSCWNILEHYNLLSTLGKGVLSDYTSANAENFICKVYKATTVSADNARSSLFAQGHPLETLSPTQVLSILYPFTSSGHTTKHQCGYRLTSSVL